MTIKHFTVAILLICQICSFAQTKVDLKAQGKNNDFRTANNTYPFRTGSAIPPSCTLGEVFFLTSAASGLNVYLCTQDGVWSLQGVVSPIGTAEGSFLTTGTTALQWKSLNGDVSGTPAALKVQGLQSLPVSATVPQTGQVLQWDGTIWRGQTINGSPGTISFESNGSVVGTKGVVNFLPGFGLTSALTNTSTKLTVQYFIDTSKIVSRASLQAGADLACTPASGSATNYVCAMTPTLAAYATGMQINWKPDVNGGGGATGLEIDSLGPKSIKLADGLTDPLPGDILAGRSQQLWYDGTVFRLVAPTSSVVTTQGVRPACAMAYRGKIWHQFSDAGTQDNVAVCAKDASNGYGWRTLY